MGDDGQVIHLLTGEGVWRMPAILRQALGDAVDAVPAASRNYNFYAPLLAPVIASAGSVDIDSLRQRGEVNVAIIQTSPVDLSLSYTRELKSGSRGASGGDVLGTVTSAIDVPEPLNELTQDYGVRAAFNFRFGDIHASLNRNMYNDRVDSLIVDNPFGATDFPCTSTAAPGGPAQVRFGTAPDNEATRIAAGAQLKFPMQTRIYADLAVGEWTQDAAFLPFTINSVILTPSGARADSLSTLPRQSLDGKIDTKSLNLGITTRLIPGTFLRALPRIRPREQDVAHLVAGRQHVGIARPFVDLDDGVRRCAVRLRDRQPVRQQLEALRRPVRVRDQGPPARSGVSAHRDGAHVARGDVGQGGRVSFAAVLRSWERLNLRAMYEFLDRSAKGWDPTTSIGLQADEAARERTRYGAEIDLSPVPSLDLIFSAYRWNDDYVNRPRRVASVPGTESGLLEASYDTYTAEIAFTPVARADFGAYYTYEKNEQTNRWHTLTSGALNNSLNYAGRDKGDTFGAHAVLEPVPGTWKCTLFLTHQKVDGLMDITAREADSFYTPGRTTLIPPG
jgi:hypothetical protein